MDAQIECAINDVKESFQIISRISDPLVAIYDIEQLKEFHKVRIKLNLDALQKCLEEL